MATPRFWITPQQMHSTELELTGEELHHLRVRRVRTGDQVLLVDGSGQECTALVDRIDRTRAILHLSPGVTPSGRGPALHLALAVGVIKPDRLDFVVEKGTELGVTELLLFTSARTQRRGIGSRMERWRRIAVAATKQCQRSQLLALHDPIPLADLLRQRHDDLKIALSHTSPCSLSTVHGTRPNVASVCIVVGPEGGLDDQELACAHAMGFVLCRMGGFVMRTETAAIAAAAVAQALWADI